MTTFLSPASSSASPGEEPETLVSLEETCMVGWPVILPLCRRRPSRRLPRPAPCRLPAVPRLRPPLPPAWRHPLLPPRPPLPPACPHPRRPPWPATRWENETLLCHKEEYDLISQTEGPSSPTGAVKPDRKRMRSEEGGEAPDEGRCSQCRVPLSCPKTRFDSALTGDVQCVAPSALHCTVQYSVAPSAVQCRAFSFIEH